MKWLSLAAGSLAGGFARYFMTRAVFSLGGTNFPYGTLAVNLLGCFLIGFFDVLAEKKLSWGPHARVLLLVGFCGAFTTFSTLIFDTADLMRSGQMFRAFANVALSVFLGLILFRIGILVGEIL